MARGVWSLALLGVGISAAATALAFEWGGSIDRAKEQAQKENRLVLLDFSADWCPPCNAMDAETWARPDVAAAARKFVCVRNDWGEHGSTASDYYHVAAIPTMLVLTAKGDVLLRVPGYRSALEVVELLGPFPARQTEVDSLVARAAAASDPAAALELATELTRRRLFDASTDVLKRVQRSKAVRADTTMRERAETLAAVNVLHTDPEKAINGLEDCLKRYPLGALRREQLSALVRASAGVGSVPKLQKYLGMLEREFPDDTLTHQTQRFLGERP